MQGRGREEEGPTCGCLEEERKGASEKCTTFEVGVHADPPQKTTSDSNTCERHQTASLPIPPPNNTSAAPQRASANAQVIDADAW